MSVPAVRGPRGPFHARTKSSRTTSETDHRPRRPVRRTQSSDIENDAATASFVRRILCAGHVRAGADITNKPLEELLPPLTSSNDVDLQLYAIIAVIIRDFVQAWYGQITPDHDFVDEVVQIIAHCSRGLEQRLRAANTEALILVELPAVLNAHADAFRVASVSNGISSPAISRRAIYHALHPHPALSPAASELDDDPAQTENELIWRQSLTSGILDNLLPPEDLQNPCLKALVSEIVSELIIGSVLSAKISQGWFIWDGISKAIQAVRNDPHDVNKPKQNDRLQKYGLTTEQPPPTGRVQERPARRVRSLYLMIINLGWEIIRILLLVYAGLSAAFIAVRDAVYLPPRGLPTSRDAISGPVRLAIIESPLWELPASLLGLDATVPWLVGAVSFLQRYALFGPGRIAALDSRVDRLLAHHITAAVSDPKRLPSLLRSVRATLFPNNRLAKGKPPPSTEPEKAAIKRQCARDILTLIPDAVRKMYFGPRPLPRGGTTTATTKEQAGALSREEHEVKRVEEVLDVFGDAYLNKHWIFAVLEVVACRLFPELTGVEGVSDGKLTDE